MKLSRVIRNILHGECTRRLLEILDCKRIGVSLSPTFKKNAIK